MLDLVKRAFATALLLALACPAAAQAEKNAPRPAAEPVHWVAPWREGLVLRYAAEDYDVSEGAAGRSVSRTTSVETIRITRAREDGFVQEWSYADTRYEQLEGGEEQEAMMQMFIDALPDLRLEADLDAFGNFAALRNLDQLVELLRPPLREGMEAMFESGVQAAGGWPADPEEAAAARERGRAFVDGVVERMTAPAVIATLLSSDVVAFNDGFGAELADGVPLEVEVDIDSPLGVGSVPARVALLMRAGAPGSDEAVLEWTTRMDREKAAAAALGAAEQMFGVDASEEERARIVADMSIVDTGSARFRRSTGVPLMLETTRTVEAAGERRVERRRMRLLDDDHGHEWPADAPRAPAGEAVEG